MTQSKVYALEIGFGTVTILSRDDWRTDPLAAAERALGGLDTFIVGADRRYVGVVHEWSARNGSQPNHLASMIYGGQLYGRAFVWPDANVDDPGADVGIDGRFVTMLANAAIRLRDGFDPQEVFASIVRPYAQAQANAR